MWYIWSLLAGISDNACDEIDLFYTEVQDIILFITLWNLFRKNVQYQYLSELLTKI